MSRYAAVPDNFVFTNVAQAVKDAGYATDPTYSEKLIRTYATYDLGRFDTGFLTEIVEEIEEIIEEDAQMAFKVVIDAGHGKGTPGKRSPVGEREWTFNEVVARAAIAELNRYANVEVLRTDDPTGNTDISLANRTARANSWGGSILVSIHHNANTGRWGTWTGTETYVMTPASANPGSMKLANEVHPRLVKAMGLRNRGIKAANFHMLRVSKMPAILTEGGYMDSTIDIVKMRNKTVLTNAGKAIAQGIAAYGGLKLKATAPKPTPVSNPNLYRVRKLWSDSDSQIGAYADLEGAKVIADANITYNVYDSKGNVVYNPREERDKRIAEEAAKAAAAKAKAEAEAAKAKAEAEAKAAAEKAEAERKEAEAQAAAIEAAREEAANNKLAMIATAIVMNSERDYEYARKIHIITGYPMFERKGLLNRKVAAHIIGIGGTEDELIDNNADKVTMITGATLADTQKAVDEYIANKLK
jgi:N-acetylmuramoyl-L-alanine amidase